MKAANAVMADWLCITDKKNVSEIKASVHKNKQKKSMMVCIEWVIAADEWKTCRFESPSCLRHDTFLLRAAAVSGLVDIMSLSPSKHSTCKQGTSAGKAILPLGPHLSFPIHTALCTHLNDKLVCTQIHYEHLGTEWEERMTVTGWKFHNKSNEVGAVTCFRVLLHALSHSRSYWMILRRMAEQILKNETDYWSRFNWTVLKQNSDRPPRLEAPATVAGRVPALRWEMGWGSSWRPACWLAAQARRCVARWRGTAAPALHGNIGTTRCSEQQRREKDTTEFYHTLWHTENNCFPPKQPTVRPFQ